MVWMSVKRSLRVNRRYPGCVIQPWEARNDIVEIWKGPGTQRHIEETRKGHGSPKLDFREFWRDVERHKQFFWNIWKGFGCLEDVLVALKFPGNHRNLEFQKGFGVQGDLEFWRALRRMAVLDPCGTWEIFRVTEEPGLGVWSLQPSIEFHGSGNREKTETYIKTVQNFKEISTPLQKSRRREREKKKWHGRR